MIQPNSETHQAAGGGPPGGYGPPPGGGAGGFGAPPGAPPGPPGGAPPAGGGWGAPPGGYGAPPGGAPGGFGAPPPGAPPGGPPGGGDVEGQAQTWFIISIVTTLLCCLPAGIVGIIFTNEAKNLAARGDYATAQSKLGTGKIACYVGIGGSLVIGVLWVILAVVGAAL